MDPEHTSFRAGALPGAAVAAAAAVCMLAANRRTINPVSATFLVAWWMIAGAALGMAAGWIGGRAAVAFRRPAALGTAPFAAMVVGYLLLPVGGGLVLGLSTLLLLILRRWLLPRAPRLDPAFAVGIAAMVPSILAGQGPGLPPPLPPDAPLAASSPAPGSVPVTISLHRESGFPEVPATHVPLRALDSAEPGVRAALWSGRLPARTRAGSRRPARLPGGGGVSRWWDAPGIAVLLAPFGPPPRLDGTPFATTGTLEALVNASGIPVLRGPPTAGDPDHYLRILEAEEAPDLETARRLRDPGAWIDLTLRPEGDSGLALSGTGIAIGRFEGEASVVDVMPTALHLLGLAIPRSVDGRVLLEVLQNPGPGSRPLRYRTLGPPPSASDSTTAR